MSADCARALMQQTNLPRLEARMLLEHVLQRPRSWLLAHDTDTLDPALIERYEALAQRRLAGEPMAYLVQKREFMGHDFYVAPGVLIPRPDTELLVETALAHLDGTRGSGHERSTVLDLGTGSGAVAISIALGCAQARVVGTDVSSDALRIARRNGLTLGAVVDWRPGSWYDAVDPTERFDLIVSNPPYIARDDPHLLEGDLRFEPEGALTDGADGLNDLATLISGAARHLHEGGGIWLEHGWQQAPAVRNLLIQAGFQNVRSLDDLAGIARISGGHL